MRDFFEDAAWLYIFSMLAAVVVVAILSFV